jgi:DNA modification methylase
MTATVLRADALALPLADESVDLVVTSPPYFGLRSYTDGCTTCDATGRARRPDSHRLKVCLNCGLVADRKRCNKCGASMKWPPRAASSEDACPDCNGTGKGHYAGQLGSEATPAEFVDALLAATREMVRVLKPSGSIWVNLGDKYSTSMYSHSSVRNVPQPDGEWSLTGQRGMPNVQANRQDPVVPQKSLLGIPWRYALACIDQLGLILRAEVIWSKPNGLPESVTDRVRRSHETWFHMVRQPRYYSAVDEIRAGHVRQPRPNERLQLPGGGFPGQRQIPGRSDYGQPASKPTDFNPLGKLPGSVWTIPTEPLTVPAELGVDHFAAFPTEWPRRIIAGWSPPGICVGCGEGRRPVRGVDWGKVPHRMVEKRALTGSESAVWCAQFADWCDRSEITKRDLDEAAGTSDMGGWWASRLPHRAQIPTPEQWAKIRARFNPPEDLDDLVHLTRIVPVAERDMRDVAIAGRNRATGGGLGMPVMSITGYTCACPSPDAPTRPAVVLDPFGGTGTVALVADVLGRHGISVDLSADYNRLAAWRTTDPGQRAKAARVEKPPPVIDGQLTLEVGT